MFKGSFVALITPFRNGAVDESAFQEHVAWQLGQGTHGLVPIGTTGECPALEDDEQERLIALCVEVAKGRAPVIPGTGFNSTAHTIHATKVAKKAGADAALVVCPYYNKPTQEGLYRHFMTLADRVDLPIVLYNIPGRTGITMTPQTVARLNKHPNIVAIKEATGSLDMASEIMSLCDITVISGDDSLTVPLMSIGATGVITGATVRMVPTTVTRRV